MLRRFAAALLIAGCSTPTPADYCQHAAECGELHHTEQQCEAQFQLFGDCADDLARCADQQCGSLDACVAAALLPCSHPLGDAGQ